MADAKPSRTPVQQALEENAKPRLSPSQKALEKDEDRIDRISKLIRSVWGSDDLVMELSMADLKNERRPDLFTRLEKQQLPRLEILANGVKSKLGVTFGGSVSEHRKICWSILHAYLENFTRCATDYFKTGNYSLSFFLDPINNDVNTCARKLITALEVMGEWQTHLPPMEHSIDEVISELHKIKAATLRAPDTGGRPPEFWHTAAQSLVEQIRVELDKAGCQSDYLSNNPNYNPIFEIVSELIDDTVFSILPRSRGKQKKLKITANTVANAMRRRDRSASQT